MQESGAGNETFVYEEGWTTRAIKLTFYILIFAVGLVGNVLVCLVVCRQRRLRTSTNYFILNLACADLAVILFCIPFDIAVQENGYRWPFGDVLCRIIYPFMTLLSFASVGTLTGIAMNRYHAISAPMRVNTAGKKRARVVIIGVWFLSVAVSLPYAAALKFNESSHQCKETWTDANRRFYTVFEFVMQYCVPLVISTVAYISIGIQLHRNRAHMTAAHRAQDRDVRKVVRMMVIVVLLFAFCMLPNQILWILKDFYSTSPMQDELLSWGAILIYANSCSNPIVYSICVEEFRVAFKAYIFKCHNVREEDLAAVGRLFERLSVRRSSRLSSLNSRSLQRASHTNNTRQEQAILTPAQSPLASTRNGSYQEPKGKAGPLPGERKKNKHSGMIDRMSGRPKMKKQGIKVTVV